MNYIVIKPFRDGISGFKIPGETISLDDTRAAKLRRMGLIGGRCVEQVMEVEPAIETAVKNGPEEDATVAKFEELAGIYPESKTYAKKLADAKEKAKKAKKVK